MFRMQPEPEVLIEDRTSALTDREREVLLLLGDGLSTKEIAERLEISPSTASIHVCHMYEKLGVHRAVSAVRYAIRVGFMSA